MARTTIAIEDAAREAGRPVVHLTAETVERLSQHRANVWEALYAWLLENGHATGLKNHEMHIHTRVGAKTMTALRAADRKRIRRSVRLARVDGRLQRVPLGRGRPPTKEEVEGMLNYNDGDSGPMETDHMGRRLRGDGLYVVVP